MWRLLILLVFALSLSVISAQELPGHSEIYRLIHDSSKTRAGDVYWVEIFQRNDGPALEWTMSQVERVGQELELTCYRALFIGEGTPIYTVNGDPIPLQTAQQLREVFHGRRLILNSERFITGDVECLSEGSPVIAMVNDYEAELCRFSGTDAGAVFRTKGQVNAQGELWTSVDEGFLVRYVFTAEGTVDGSNNTVQHTYELMPPQDFQITLPTDINLQCFEEYFPELPQTRIVANNLNYLAALSELAPADLWIEIDLVLLELGWRLLLNEARPEHRFFERELENGDICRLRAQVRTSEAGTQLGVTVSPQVNIANVDLPDGWESPVVIQNADFVTRYQGTVGEAAAEYIELGEVNGWVVRAAFTDIRDDSALVVLTDGMQEQYITIDTFGKEAVVRVQFADVCVGERENPS